MPAPYRKTDLGAADVAIERRPDGVIVVRSREPLPAYPDKMTDRLIHWAKAAPDRIAFAQRDGASGWNSITYAELLAATRGVATALLARNLSRERPVAFLSGNDLGQVVMALACQYIGQPFAPISPAYSLMSQDFGKLRHIFSLLDPSLVYVSQASPFLKAIEAIVPAKIEIVVAVDPPPSRPTAKLADLIATTPSPGIETANAQVGPETIAKILFTSGSTGAPKGVINTQRMQCSNQVMQSAALRFSLREPPVLVDWLPWSHTFGGNHNFNHTIMNGGSFYIDDGRPVPGGIATTVRNLKEIAPTVYFNVPRGFEALLPDMERDPALAKNFFSKLNVLFYAGASLPQHVWDALESLSIRTTGERVRMLTGLGSTETAPAAINSNELSERAGMVGLPLPGVELKLVPNAGKMELRLRGPNIMPGYWKNPEQTKAAFDEEGFYKIGDALKFADETDPRKGFVFDGRVAEDFKLVTGTWVSVGSIRAAVIEAFQPLVRDAVIAGHDKGEITALLVPDPELCRLASGLAASATPAEVYASPVLLAEIRRRLQALAKSNGSSSTRVERVMLLAEPLSLDRGEVTDKGSINQRAVLANRAALVEALYAGKADARVVVSG